MLEVPDTQDDARASQVPEMHEDEPYLTTPEQARRLLSEKGYTDEDYDRWMQFGEKNLAAHVIRALITIARGDVPVDENNLMIELQTQDAAQIEDLDRAVGILGFFEPPQLKKMRHAAVGALMKRPSELPLEFRAYHMKLNHFLKRQIALEKDPVKRAYPYEIKSGAAIAEATLFRDSGRLELYLNALNKILEINSDDMIGTRILREIQEVRDKIKK